MFRRCCRIVPKLEVDYVYEFDYSGGFMRNLCLRINLELIKKLPGAMCKRP